MNIEKEQTVAAYFINSLDCRIEEVQLSKADIEDRIKSENRDSIAIMLGCNEWVNDFLIINSFASFNREVNYGFNLDGEGFFGNGLILAGKGGNGQMNACAPAMTTEKLSKCISFWSDEEDEQ